MNHTSPVRVTDFSDIGQYDDAFLDPELCHTQLAVDLMRINDNRDSKVESKIEQIREKLEAYGHELEVIEA